MCTSSSQSREQTLSLAAPSGKTLLVGTKGLSCSEVPLFLLTSLPQGFPHTPSFSSPSHQSLIEPSSLSVASWEVYSGLTSSLATSFLLLSKTLCSTAPSPQTGFLQCPLLLGQPALDTKNQKSGLEAEWLARRLVTEIPPLPTAQDTHSHSFPPNSVTRSLAPLKSMGLLHGIRISPCASVGKESAKEEDCTECLTPASSPCKDSPP